jgi:hypothetical protein
VTKVVAVTEIPPCSVCVFAGSITPRPGIYNSALQIWAASQLRASWGDLCGQHIEDYGYPHSSVTERRVLREAAT